MAKHLIKTEKQGMLFVSTFVDMLHGVERRVEGVLADKYGIGYPYIGRACDSECASDDGGAFGSASEVFYMENHAMRNRTVSVFCTCCWGYSGHDDVMDVSVIYHGEDRPSDRVRVYVAQGKAARDRALKKVESLILRHCLRLHRERSGE